MSQNIDWTTFLPYVACSWVGGNQQTSTFKITVTGQQYLSLHGILCLRQTTPRLISIIMGANGISNIYFNDQTGITYSISGNVVTINYPGISWSDCGLIYLKIPGSPGIEATVGR